MPPESNPKNFWLSAEKLQKHRVTEEVVEYLMAGKPEQKLWAKFQKPCSYPRNASIRWTTLQARA